MSDYELRKQLSNGLIDAQEYTGIRLAQLNKQHNYVDANIRPNTKGINTRPLTKRRNG